MTLTNLNTNERHGTVSGRDGLIQFLNLTPASYRLDVEMAGFSHYVREPILVEVQRIVRIDECEGALGHDGSGGIHRVVEMGRAHLAIYPGKLSYRRQVRIPGKPH